MPDLYSCEEAWYCLKALPKKEHMAATMLRKECRMDALAPRIRYMKKTRRGKVQFVEPLFPGYVFVHTALKDTYRYVMSAHGVRGVVAYGNNVPRVPPSFVQEIRSRLPEPDDAFYDQEPAVRVGQEATVTEGPFHNWHGIITGVIPARGRVRILLELLGQQLNVDVPARAIMTAEHCSPHERVWKA